MAEAPVTNPHDALFKGVFGDRANAMAHFRRFLAREVTERLDMERAVLEPGSFVDEELRENHADLLWVVPWRDEDGGAGGEAEAGEGEREAGDGEAGAGERPPALLYLLFEHQSAGHPLMPYRLLVYMMRIWERWFREHKDARRLPAILPVVMYHGRSEWSAPTRFHQILEIPDPARPLIEPHTPGFEMVLHDLPRMDDATLAQGGIEGLARLLLARARERALLKRLGPWLGLIADALTERPDATRFVLMQMRYILETNEEVDEQALIDLVTARVGAEAGAATMTAADRLRREGRAEGRTEERRRVLLKLITLRFGPVSDGITARVFDASDAEVEVWIEAILTAGSLADLLATTPGR